MRNFKLFVSSPGDVMVERRRVENVVSRLNGEFAGEARLEAIRWETNFYQAFSTFQAQIPRSTDCDLVIGILKWRLGTELPPEFAEKLADGRSFPSGTAYEILTAVENRRKGEKLPDVYVFRFAGSSPSIAIEDPNRAKIEHDWQALKSFFQEWFLSERGHFRAAFNSYGSEDDFEAQLEKLLRKWIADKVMGGRALRWPIAAKGSPFRGLSAFGAGHAAVFFGRSHDTARAVDLWREAGSRGSPCLLILGASGSGKSSLARAGLLPRLATPGVIKEVDAWRIAAMRPSDSPDGPFAALAAALMQAEADLPKEEEGRGPALPEIGRGDSQTPAELAAVLRHADAAAVKPIANALARVEAAERAREHYDRPVRCDLVLLIDQLEELFAATVSEDDRCGFIDLLAALVATGRVWVAVTLRADFYARVLDQPVLKKLKELGATYDLAPPGPVELAEIVRGPADAAGLVFETDTATGESLDTRLLRDADRPDMLPLVQLALARLFEGRDSIGGEIQLPLKVYEGLGGLRGIVNEAGETALASLGEIEKARLPRLLRQLAVPAQEQDGAGHGALTIRAIPLAQAAADGPSRKLLDALVSARLLTASGVDADAQVRLAHQRVLEDWTRARAVVADSADFYRIRAELEESRRRWETGKRRRELLIPRGLPLAEAESIVGKYCDELSAEAVAYVRASRRRANQGQMIAWSAAAAFFLVAVGAGIATEVAFDQRSVADAARVQAQAETQRADRNFVAAKQTVDVLIFNIVQGLRGLVGMRVDTTRKILDTVQKATDQLIEAAPNDPQLLRSRSAMFVNLTDVYLAAGDLQDAAAAAAQSLDIARKLAAQDPRDAQAQLDLSVNLERLGDVKLRGGDRTEALAAYQESLDIRRKLAALDPGKAEVQRDISLDLGKLGDAKFQGGDRAGALAAYQEGLDIARKLAAQYPGNTLAQHDISVNLSRLGDVKLKEGDRAGALAAYQESLDISRKLAAQDLGNAQAQRDLAQSLEHLGDVTVPGGDRAGALAAYQESLDVFRKLAARDPGSAEAQRDVAVELQKLGDAKLQGDGAGAFVAYQGSLDIFRKLATQDPGNAQAQRDVLLDLGRLADTKRQGGDRAGALAGYQESLDISRKLAAQDPGNALAQRDMTVNLERLGDMKLRGGDRVGALAAYQESVDVLRKLAAQDSGNGQLQRDMTLNLGRLGDVKLQGGDRVGALVAYQESVDVLRKLAAHDPGNAQAQRDTTGNLGRLGDLKLQNGDRAGALAAYQESVDVSRKLAMQGSGSAQMQRDLLVSLQKIGDLRLQGGDQAGALATDQESLDIARKLAAQEPGNAQAQRDVVVSLDRLGDAKARGSDRAGALAHYQESLDMARKLAAADPGNAPAEIDLVIGLYKVGTLAGPAQARTGLTEALSIVSKLDEEHKLTPGQKNWPDILRSALSKLP